MSITRVAQSINSGDGTNFDHSKASAALNVPSGALIVVKFSSPQSGNITTAPTDTAGNTYTKAQSQSASNEQAIWYCLNATANASNVVTASFSNGCNEYGYTVEVYTGGTWTYDATNSGVVAGSYTTSATVSPSLSTSGAGLIATCFGQYDWPRAGNSATQTPGSVISSSIDTPTGTTCVMASGEVINASAFSGTVSVNIQQPTPANTKCDLTYASFLSSGGGGGGAISGTANLGFTAAGTIAGAGALMGAAGLAFTAAATAAGKAAAAGAANLAFAATATLKGAGALAGAAALVFAAGGSLAGAGSLAGNAGLAFTANGTATGLSGALSGSAPLVFGTTGMLAGSGALVGSAPLGFTAVGNAAGSGALAGNALLTFTATARPNGSSALAGSASFAFTTTGTLGGTGALGGTAPLTWTAGATVQGAGTLAGHSGLVFTAQATPSAQVSIQGVAGLTFTATGTLTNGVPVFPVDPRYYAAIGFRPFYVSANARNFYVMANPNITPMLDTKDPRESVVVTLDGSNDLVAGETLTSVESTSVTVIAGTDPAQSLIVGTPAINWAPVTFPLPNGQTVTVGAGKGVQAEVSAGLTNCRYLIAVTCNTSNPDKILTLKGILPVSAS